MRATVDAKDFSKALSSVTKVPKRSAMPVMEGVLVQIKDGCCTLTATDFTTWLTTTIPAVGDNLSFVFQRPRDAAQACAYFDGELTLEVVERSNHKDCRLQLTMSCGPRIAQIEAFVSEDYPAMPENQVRHTYTVNAARLLERVERVKYALKKPDDRLEAQRTYVQFSGNKVFALDVYRLAWDVDDSLPVEQPFMVMPDALGYLKYFGNQEIMVSMGVNYLQMTDGAMTIQTRIEGPLVFDIDSAVPQKFQEEFYIHPKEFLQELDYLKKLSRGTDKTYVHFSSGQLIMRVSSGCYRTKIQLDRASSIDFKFELHYMIDALRQFRGEPWVKMKLNSPVAPVILEAEGRRDFAMVLPARVNWAAAV